MHTHTHTHTLNLPLHYYTHNILHYMYVCVYMYIHTLCLSSPTHSLQLVNNINDLLLLQCHCEYGFFLFEPHNWLFQIVCVPIMFWYFESLLYTWGIYLSFSFPPFLSFTSPSPSLSLYMVIVFVYKIGRNSRSNAGTGEEGRRWGEGREGGLRYNVNILVEKCQRHKQPIKREEEGEEKGRETHTQNTV